jgi:hypothetical protein
MQDNSWTWTRLLTKSMKEMQHKPANTANCILLPDEPQTWLPSVRLGPPQDRRTYSMVFRKSNKGKNDSKGVQGYYLVVLFGYYVTGFGVAVPLASPAEKAWVTKARSILIQTELQTGVPRDITIREAVDTLHRLVLLFAQGPPTADHVLRNATQAQHTCNNKRCINPFHLYWGNKKENAADIRRPHPCPWPDYSNVNAFNHLPPVQKLLWALVSNFHLPSNVL